MDWRFIGLIENCNRLVWDPGGLVYGNQGLRPLWIEVEVDVEVVDIRGE